MSSCTCLFFSLPPSHFSIFFFFNDTAPTEIYTLSLHDALPISSSALHPFGAGPWGRIGVAQCRRTKDRKSTRLNSSHSQISYAVFCLKKKKKIHILASEVEIGVVCDCELSLCDLSSDIRPPRGL